MPSVENATFNRQNYRNNEYPLPKTKEFFKGIKKQQTDRVIKYTIIARTKDVFLIAVSVSHVILVEVDD